MSKLLHKDHPLIRTKTKFFDFENPVIDPMELRNEMMDEMFDNGGIGLSANQIGYDCSVFVMKGQNKEQSMFIANPEILEESEDKVLIEEGCLTPGCDGIFATVSRPSWIRARWQDEHGELKELEFSGMTCRCFQHEYDHLQGILFIDHLSRLKYDRAVKKKQKREKQYARFREQYLQQFVQIAREHRNSNSELPDEGTVSETDKVSQS